MANDQNGNPLYIETTTGASISNMVRIQAIAWMHTEAHPIAADDDLEIQNGSGRTLLKARQAAAGEHLLLTFPSPFVADGLSITALDGGELYIYMA